MIHPYVFSLVSARSPGKNYSYAIKFTPGSAGFNMVRKYKFLGLYKVETYPKFFPRDSGSHPYLERMEYV